MRHGWQSILLNTTRPYEILKETSNTSIETCLSWFYNIFYQRLFDIYPTCKSLFAHDPYCQGKFLLRLITTLLQDPASDSQYRSAVSALAVELSNKRFRPYELGILGDVLFYALEQCLGVERYSFEVDMCWKKAFSHLMVQIIPLCIEVNKNNKRKDIRLHVSLPHTPSASLASTASA